ncbi:hypothetical protein IWW45_003989 [Coemansia sp. RSA 485]|nr:hypothetical protein IWW45_003989 [Coemansia sp. RSA 485]
MEAPAVSTLALSEQQIMLGQEINSSGNSNDLATALSTGDYEQVLCSAPAKAIFGSDLGDASSIGSIVSGTTPFDSEFAASDISEFVTALAQRYVQEHGPEGWRQMTWVGAACLNAFIQTNWTGPELVLDPISLFPGDIDTRLAESFIATQVLELPEDADKHEIGRREHMGGRVYLGAKQSEARKRFDRDVLRLLERDGEEAYSLTPRALYLYFARLLLVDIPANNVDARDAASPVAQWWAARTVRVQQTLLEYPSQTLLNEILTHYAAASRALPESPVRQAYTNRLAKSVEKQGTMDDYSMDDDIFEVIEAKKAEKAHDPMTRSDQLGSAGSSAATSSVAAVDVAAWETVDSDSREIWARYLLEIAVAFSQHQMAADSTQHLAQAQAASGLEWKMTGVKGRRTKFQSFDVTQLVVDATSRKRAGDAADEENERVPENMKINDDTLLEEIALTGDAPDAAPLAVIDRCILLALCQNVENENPVNGLTSEQMRPFISRVLDRASNWSVYTTGLLQRSRLEASKTRTAERSVLQLQALVDQIARPQPGELEAGASERLAYLPVLALPSQWDLESELARRFVSLGVIRSALDIFERLEQWDEVIASFVLLGQEEVAERFVQDQLAATPDRPKLWCVLGDLKKDPDHWRHAWEISGCRYARAMRSLGAYHYEQSQFDKAAECYKKALHLNPLFEKSWFLLGCASLQTEDWKTAVQAFQRVVALDHERGDAWNNLASAYLQMGQGSSERAWYALREATRCNFDSWKVWSNFMHTSLSLHQYASAIHAMSRIVTLRAESEGAASVDLEALRTIISVLTRGTLVEGLPPAAAQRKEEQYTRYVEHLLVEQIETRITRSAPLWRTMAEFWFWRKDYSHCLDCHVKAHRALAQQAEISYDAALFKEAVDSVLELVSAYENLGDKTQTVRQPSSENTDGENQQAESRKSAAVEQPVCPDWRRQAKMALRSLVGKGKQSFEGTPEYVRLTDALEELC